MHAECHTYEAAGWGVGELWLRGSRVVHHELSFEALAGVAASAPALSPPPRRLPPIPGPSPGLARGSRTAARSRETHPPQGGAKSPTGTIAENLLQVGDGFAEDLCQRFCRHLAGEAVSYREVELELDWCTPFERALAAALREVPWGEVVSYGELAALAGRPRAARAAGTFCAGNRFMLVLPCHRVVAAGGIGGYGSSGVEAKRRLLALEGVRL